MSGIMDESLSVVGDVLEGAASVVGACIGTVITSGIAIGSVVAKGGYIALKTTGVIAYEAGKLVGNAAIEVAKTTAQVGLEAAKITAKVGLETAKITAKVGLETGKFVGVTALGAAYGMGQGAINSISGIKDGIVELQHIALEEKRQLDLAQSALHKHLKENRLEMEAYIKASIENLDFLNLSIDKVNLSNSIISSKDEPLNLLSDISVASYYHQKFQESAFLLSEMNVPIGSIEESFYETREKFIHAINHKKFNELHAINSEFSTQIDQLRSIYDHHLKASNIHIDKLEGIFFTVENMLELPFTRVFENELYQFLKNTLDTDANEAKKSILLDLKKNILSMYMDISNLAHGQDYIELKQLVDSVNTILDDTELSDDTKIDMLNTRYKVLGHNYITLTSKHQQTLVDKREYDVLYQMDYSYRKYLNMTLPDYHFDPTNSKNAIQYLKTDIDEIKPQVEKKHEQMVFRKVVSDVMKEMQFAHIVSSEEKMGHSDVLKDVYHIENGNVVTVSVFPNGEMNYRVSAVETQGIPSNKNEVVKTMHTFCNKAATIREKLREKGVMSANNELLEPNIKYVKEIVLDAHVNASKKELIRKAKLGTIRSNTLKERAIE